MKTFRNVILVKYPQQQVWQAIRDRLPELVPFLDDVASITIENRQQNTDIMQLTNIWKSDINIPSMVQSIIDTNTLSWTDRAEWYEKENKCKWTIEPHFIKNRIQCSGYTKFEPALGGRGTRITFEGQLEINTKNIPGLPGFMEDSATKTIESLITILIPKNFRNITDALSILLDQKR